MTKTKAVVCVECGAKGRAPAVTRGPIYCEPCMGNRARKRGQRVATCRHCGAIGIEDISDPCPGVCPACVEAGLASAFRIHSQLASDGCDTPLNSPSYPLNGGASFTEAN